MQKRNIDSNRKRLHTTKNACFSNKNVPFLCHCEAATLPWQSLSQRHGIPWRGTGAENDKIPRGRSEFHCKTIFTCPMGKFHMRSIFHLLKEQISLRSHARPKAVFHCEAMPCLVPGCRFVPFKIAASGARTLLAMTKSAGFAGKRNNFWNEKFQIRPGGALQKLCRIIGWTPQKLRRIIGKAKEKSQSKKPV